MYSRHLVECPRKQLSDPSPGSFKMAVISILRPVYTAHCDKFQRLPLSFCFWNKLPSYFVLEFQKQVPETFAVYAGHGPSSHLWRVTNVW